ncbi:MAG: response regulator [Chthoniobacteraceae bacterium]
MPAHDAFRILVVEDDRRIRDVLEYALQAEGWAVQLVSRGQEAVSTCRENAPGLVVLDIGLPDVDGFEVCRQLRTFSQVPVLFLTSRGDEINRVVGLEIGGDDYVVKPFSPRELVARIKAIRRRLTPQAPATATGASVHYGPIAIDPARFTVTCDGEPVSLTKQEFRLLEILAGQPGRVFTRDQLLDQAWPEGGLVTDRTIDAHIKTLRKKFTAHDFIETVRGIGYRAREL